ncbi:hypothetical protein KPL71_001021 [Citrus sinensis]|uniref:Uncharacterized protein n=1 Tax=Citrus sinensis TaxID=2711 RepID=A0ACB8NU82_CITSI|nr:hypothetical protein KPL71_001021 [Citrus sinensis]
MSQTFDCKIHFSINHGTCMKYHNNFGIGCYRSTHYSLSVFSFYFIFNFLKRLKTREFPFPLFINTGWVENPNIGFLKKHMGVSFEPRPEPWVTNVTVEAIHSGDFLVEWLTGAYAGYTVDCLRESEGMLWVGESEHENDKVNRDDSNPHIALLPLQPDMQTAAWEYALSRDGKPYEYHNMTSSWIDTRSGDQLPPGCSSGSFMFGLLPFWSYQVASGMTMWNHIQPAYAANMLMGSQHHMYCVPFVLEMYKEAGLFDPIASSIRATEFTVKDAYLVRFFENNSSRLPKWCNDADTVKLPNCQIRGKYRLELPVYNVLDPYPNMNERYPSMPSRYSRIANC